MKFKPLGLAVLLTAFAGSAFAQNHISATEKCGKPDDSKQLEVGDQPNHVLLIEKVGTCTFSVPFEIAGLKSTTATGAEFVDITGAKVQARGYHFTTMENGDKAYARFQGTGNVKENGNTGEGTWSYTGGTGKLKGLKGKGTYKLSGDQGATEVQVEGEYSLPEPKVTAKKK